MPRYLNRSSKPAYIGEKVLPGNVGTFCLDVAKLNAEVISNIPEPYNIVTGINDILKIRFNEDSAWTSITLTAGAARTAAQIAADINAIFAGVASADSQNRVKIIAPVMANKHSSKIFIADSGSTANITFGIIGSDKNPIDEGYIFLESLNPLPLYNPIINEQKLIFAGAGSSTYTLYNPDRTKFIKLFRVSASFTIAIEDAANIPYLTLESGESTIIYLPNRITKLIITAAGAGNITVRELISDKLIY